MLETAAIFIILIVGLGLLLWNQSKQSAKIDGILKQQKEEFQKEIQHEMSENRKEMAQQMGQWVGALHKQLSAGGETQIRQLELFSTRLDGLTKSNEERLESVRQTVEGRLTSLQADNASKLELMRQTVDEKLHSTLERRLGESFQTVSERLEKVHQGLGEMQTLAASVGDLRQVMTQVKTRGIWGEMQLIRLLEEFLPKQVWETNIATRPGRAERVEVAVKIPQDDPNNPFIWLPIDAKFPMEDYQRLIDAREKGEDGADALKALENRIKLEAKTIREKYVEHPYTTDFAMMFLPTESLYAEVLSRTDLVEQLQNKERIILVGPTNLTAFLASLQMGFRALAVGEQTGEILQLLGGVPSEMRKCADLLEKSRKKIQEAGNQMELAARRGRAIERQLKNIEAMPVGEEVLLAEPEEE